jgi:hypothetical protein
MLQMQTVMVLQIKIDVKMLRFNLFSWACSDLYHVVFNETFWLSRNIPVTRGKVADLWMFLYHLTILVRIEERVK